MLGAAAAVGSAGELVDRRATSVAAAGGTLPSDREYDGVNIVPYVNGENKERPHQALFWRADFGKHEGLVGGMEPFIDTIVVCTFTALIILSTGVWNRAPDVTFDGRQVLNAIACIMKKRVKILGITFLNLAEFAVSALRPAG